ncbi:ion transporter [Adlercreutzia sp. ZJ304]|uniref:ion transporter n=1 Tax=Adlercreutzia sp. ZJ304 TaxID=2709791 RepID=UPI0013ED17C3|nr:ion transporter [Adlercreutzia sp. ZJ304]
MPDEQDNQNSQDAQTKKQTRRSKLARVSNLKRQTYYALESVMCANAVGKVIGCALFILIVLNAVVVFISTQSGLDSFTSSAISAFYTFSTLCFFAEYLARIWVADIVFEDNSKAKARLHYICSPLGIIDLLSFFPSVLAWFIPMTPALRTIVNIVRLVRLVKISRYMRGLRTIGRVLEKRRHEIIAAFLVLALLIIVTSVVMYEIEHPVQPDKFSDLLSGVYWAVTTITATGYGDIAPVTPLGRAIGSVIMFLSVALVAIPGGIFSAGFVAEFQNVNRRGKKHDSSSDDENDVGNQSDNK